MLLKEVAFARSGDKGDIVDIGLFAFSKEDYALIKEQVSAKRVKAHFEPFGATRAERYEVPNLLALKFVVHGVLQGGASRSLRADNLGKTFGAMLLKMPLEP